MYVAISKGSYKTALINNSTLDPNKYCAMVFILVSKYKTSTDANGMALPSRHGFIVLRNIG